MAATGGPRCSADALAAAPGETAEEQDARMETALMLRFQASGAEHDFEALYELARGPLLLWIGSLAHSRRTGVEPAELLQDAFVNVYRYASSFRAEGPRSFRVWSRTIAGNLVRRACHLRRRAFQGLPEGLQEPRDRSAGPCAGLQENEERRQLAGAWVLLLARYAAAYEQLPPRAQAALRLVEVEGVSYQESCRRLGVGLSNLKMILFRARRRIRAAIAADLGRAPRAAEGRRSPRLRRAG
ncbi:MAG: RNA polymerase sigma factor [Planctomycetes bacterium]|nr:RNA polymerase sigma factor [Planctomycetota bacterium]